MKRVAIHFLGRGFHQVLFDAMPMPVFVMDRDVRIMEYNATAARLFGSDKRTVLRRRGGDVWHCVHATETLKGCGHAPACLDCQVRKSVQAAAHGHHVTRQWAPMELVIGGKKTK